MSVLPRVAVPAQLVVFENRAVIPPVPAVVRSSTAPPSVVEIWIDVAVGSAATK